MKRIDIMERPTYEIAVKKAQLVERNPEPNGVALLDPHRISMHQEDDIINLALTIQNADKQVKAGTCQKLCLILDQIKMLQTQALNILKESEQNHELHNAACNFVKRSGQIYHLYQKSSGQKFFSLIAPDEWNGLSAHKFVGSYRLEYDNTWTPIEKIKEQDDRIKWAEKCIETAAAHSSKQIPMAIDFNVPEQS